MKKTKLIFVFLLSFVLFACSSTNTTTKQEEAKQIKASTVSEKEYHSYLSGREAEVKNAEVVKSQVDLTYNPENTSELEALSSNIFVGKVIRFDRGVGNKGALPYTKGQLEVLSNIKGNAKGKVDFRRLGAIIEVAEDYKGSAAFRIEKANYLREQAGLGKVEDDHSLISIFEENDENLKLGSTYLFFATFDKNTNAYDIQGFSYGSLELTNKDSKNLRKSSNFEDWKLIDKTTGNEISLQTYIDENLK
ncbi:MAG: hypothetical protein ACK5KR_05060 [Breznakia sp.]